MHSPPASPDPEPLPEDPRHELGSVAFFPQDTHQCGPAALATLLVSTGVDTTPEQLVPEVYIPARRGSLQIEMLAAARRHGRTPWLLPPDFTALRTELEAGNPVLVLQDLGALGIRRWHYAVVIGYEPQREVLVLRSGTERRHLERKAYFLRSWQASDNWAVTITPPGRIPATATAAGYIRALAESESLQPAADIDASYAAALLPLAGRAAGAVCQRQPRLCRRASDCGGNQLSPPDCTAADASGRTQQSRQSADRPGLC